MRHCDKCDKEITEGFFHEESGEWFCSMECMCNEDYTQEDYEEDNENDLAFWTTCDDDEE